MQDESTKTDAGKSWATESELSRGFRSLSQEDAHDYFLGLSDEERAQLILSLRPAEGRIWMRLLPADDAASLIRTVTEEDRPLLEALLDEVTLRETQALLAFAEDEAGGLMHPRFARIRPGVSVEVALRYLRRQTQKDLATFYYAYVLDNDQRILGVVSLRELFAASGETIIEDVMEKDVISVHESVNQEDVARLIAEHDLLAIPVTDDNGAMQGLVTIDDIVDIVQQEATEDIQKLGGTEALETTYFRTSFWTMVRKRGGWLSALFFGEMLTATAMAHFEGEIAKAVVLSMFVPLIISSGGNSGSQASTLVVRAMALQELELRDWFKVLYKELASGLTLGSFLGFIGFVRVVMWQHLGLYDYGTHYTLIAFTVWASLIGVVAFGTFAGSMLPFLLRRIGADPATSSAPFVATLVDVTGLVIYFLVAAGILSGTLL